MRILVLTWRDLAHSAAGGAEVYTEQVTRRWAAAGHDVTVFASAVAGRPADEMVDGYRVAPRRRLTVYRAGVYEKATASDVIDMVNTVPFRAPVDHRHARHRLLPPDRRGVGTTTPLRSPCSAATCSSALIRAATAPSWWSRSRPLTPWPASGPQHRHPPEGFEPVAVPAVEGVAADRRLVRPARPHKRPRTWSRRPGSHASRSTCSVDHGRWPMLDDLRKDARKVHILGGWTRMTERRMARAHVHVATSAREGWGLVVTRQPHWAPTIAYNTRAQDSTMAARATVPAAAGPRGLLVEALPRLQATPVEPP